MNIKNLVKDKKILKEALMHRSFQYEHSLGYNYERLEFLGDSILSFFVSDYLYKNFHFQEGDMSKKRASFVCEDALVFYANKINLKPHIMVGEGLKKSVADSIVADVFEALIGAIYISEGFDKVKEFIYQTVIPYITDEYEFFNDYKTLIQEFFHEKGSVIYKLLEESGKDHEKLFKIAILINGINYGVGLGKTKKEAEQNAAKEVFLKKVGKDVFKKD